jgi:nucleoid DNA-binding protein
LASNRTLATAMVRDALELIDEVIDDVEYELEQGKITVIPIDGPTFEITVRITGFGNFEDE